MAFISPKYAQCEQAVAYKYERATNIIKIELMMPTM